MARTYVARREQYAWEQHCRICDEWLLGMQRRYCSDRCRSKAANYAKRDARIAPPCWCGKPLTRYQRKYCSASHRVAVWTAKRALADYWIHWWPGVRAEPRDEPGERMRVPRSQYPREKKARVAGITNLIDRTEM